jgi:hypothetical protein
MTAPFDIDAIIGAAKPLTEADLRPDVTGTPSPPNVERFRMWSDQELADRPPPSWLIEGYLTKGGSGILFGPSGQGKTFMVIHMAACVASGRAWNGHAVQPGVVVYVSAEGASGIPERLAAWRIHHGLERIEGIRFVLDAVNLMKPEDVTAFVHAIAALPVPPVLIVFDTWARCTVGGEENSSKDMGQAIAAVDHIRAATGAAIIAVHHTGKGAGDIERGSSALRGAADTMLLVRGDDGRITLTCEKQKDAAPFTATEWCLQPVEGTASCVPMPVERNEAIEGQRGESHLKAGQRRVLEAIRDAGANGATAKELAQATGYGSVQTIYSATKALLEGRWILFDKEQRRYSVGSASYSNAFQSIPKAGIGTAEPDLSLSNPFQQPLGVGILESGKGQPGPVTLLDEGEL